MSPVVGSFVFDLIEDGPGRPAAILRQAAESGVLLYDPQ